MNDADQNELSRRLRAIDHPLPFDAKTFAKGVIKERSRRRKRRVAASGCAILPLTAIAVTWCLLGRIGPQPNVNQQDILNKAATSVMDDSLRQRVDEIDSLLAQLDQRRHRLEGASELRTMAFQGRRARVIDGPIRHEGRPSNAITNKVTTSVDSSTEALAAARREQQEQMLAFSRAEFSSRVEVPDLTPFYVGPTGDASR